MSENAYRFDRVLLIKATRSSTDNYNQEYGNIANPTWLEDCRNPVALHPPNTPSAWWSYAFSALVFWCVVWAYMIYVKMKKKKQQCTCCYGEFYGIYPFERNQRIYYVNALSPIYLSNAMRYIPWLRVILFLCIVCVCVFFETNRSHWSTAMFAYSHVRCLVAVAEYAAALTADACMPRTSSSSAVRRFVNVWPMLLCVCASPHFLHDAPPSYTPVPCAVFISFYGIFCSSVCIYSETEEI